MRIEGKGGSGGREEEEWRGERFASLALVRLMQLMTYVRERLFVLCMYSKQRHPHLASVIGVCISTEMQPYIITELVDGQSLRDVISGYRSTGDYQHTFSWTQRVKLVISPSHRRTLGFWLHACRVILKRSSI